MPRATSSFALSMRGFFRVATTVPTILARSMGPDGGQEGKGLFLRLADRQRLFEVRMRPRDDVYRNELADATGCRGARVRSGLYRRDVAANNRGHVAGANLLPADQRDLRGLHHGVSRFNHGDEALGFDHPQR